MTSSGVNCVRLEMVLFVAMGLAGCLGDGRPLEDYVRDIQGQRTDGGLVILPDAPPRLCSRNGTAVQLSFINNSDRDISVFWVDQFCRELPYRTLAPGESYVQPTFSEHVWRLRDAATNAVLKDFLGVDETGETEVSYP